MRKHLLVGIAALLTLALTAPAFAQNAGDAQGGLGADEGAANSVLKNLQSNTQYFVARYQCKDGTASAIGVQVRDLFIAGDIWRGTIHSKTLINTTGNVAAAPGSPAFVPGVYSPSATIVPGLGLVKGIYVIVGSGNAAPGGLPAGWDTLITSNGAALSCKRKQVVGGTADL